MNHVLNSTSPQGSTKRIKRLPLKKRLIKLVGRCVFQGLSCTAGLLRPWSIRILGNACGSAFYALSKRYRTVALKNLRMAFGDKMSDSEIQSLAKQVFTNFSRGAFEFFYLLSLDRSDISQMIDVEGQEHIDQALAEGRGCIIVTAHYGNWELLARKLVMAGHKVNVIARDSDDPGMTGITTRIRENGGYRVFDRDQPIIGAFRALRNNEILGILPDQNDSGGILIDFFGKPAATAVGPAVLSIKSGAPIVPIFATHVSNSRYRARAYPRIEFVPSGDEKKDTRDLMALVNKAIEEEVRRHPAQWLWLHDRWKLSPGESSNGS